jgi:hypothetical protein
VSGTCSKSADVVFQLRGMPHLLRIAPGIRRRPANHSKQQKGYFVYFYLFGYFRVE